MSSDFYTIGRALEARPDLAVRAVLASVLSATGSTYRRAGARLLICEDGTMVGAISGGCLESDLLEHARGVLATGVAKRVRFSLDEDSIFGLALGCGGEIEVLLEVVTGDLRAGLSRVLERRHDGGMVAVTGVHSGTRFLDEADCSELSGEDLVERLEPVVTLAVFGAGPEAPALTVFARRVGMEVTVADHRSAYANASRLPDADRIVVAPVESLVEAAGVNERTAAVVMMHNVAHDLVLLRGLVSRGPMYLGLLGSRTRCEKLLAELASEDAAFANAAIHGPTGLDLGAETPEEIALAIVSEIVAVIRGGSGGFLRERNEPIHHRQKQRVAAIILAAGSSSRMGSAKQAIEVDGISLVRRAALAAIGGGADPVFVVTGSHAGEIELQLRDLRVTVVANPEWPEGVASSIRAGAAAARGAGSAGALVMLCDQPGVDASVVRKVIDRFEATRAGIVAARYPEGGGAPALFRAELLPALLELQGDQGARHLIRRMGEAVVLVDVPTRDVDRIEDAAEWGSRVPRDA